MKKYNALLKEPSIFIEYQLDQYNIKKSQLNAVNHTQISSQLQELQQNFINDHSFLNIGQVITSTLEEITQNEAHSKKSRLKENHLFFLEIRNF